MVFLIFIYFIITTLIKFAAAFNTYFSIRNFIRALSYVEAAVNLYRYSVRSMRVRPYLKLIVLLFFILCVIVCVCLKINICSLACTVILLNCKHRTSHFVKYALIRQTIFYYFFHLLYNVPSYTYCVDCLCYQICDTALLFTRRTFRRVACLLLYIAPELSDYALPQSCLQLVFFCAFVTRNCECYPSLEFFIGNPFFINKNKSHSNHYFALGSKTFTYMILTIFSHFVTKAHAHLICICIWKKYSCRYVLTKIIISS